MMLTRLVLLGIGVLFVVGGSAFGELERRGVETTVRVTVRTDGGNVGGRLVGWDDEGAWLETKDDGEQKVGWADFGAQRAYDVRRRLIAIDDWKGWVRIGALMLELGDDRLAGRAFGVAKKKNNNASTVVLKIRRAHERGEGVYAVLDGLETEAPPQPSRVPERELDKGGEQPEKTGDRAGPDESEAVQGVHVWEKLTDAEHAKETLRLRRMAQGMLLIGDFEIEPIETAHFLLYSDLPVSETRKWAGKLDNMYDTLTQTLDIAPGTKMFRGRCVVFIFREREDFLGFEASVFGYNAEWAGGLCHQRGEDVFVSFYKGRRADQDFQSVLIHETVHGFMYRYRSSKKLPTWANEGIADYVSGYLTERSNEPQTHWQHARNFVMRGGDAVGIMGLNYRDKSWPTDDSYPVSHMLVRFMLKHRAPAFKAWLDDVKAGKAWEQAMEARFGVSKEVLVEGFTKEMRSENRYTRLR